MQFLSVASRELKVAARKPSCFRLRMFTSVVALFIAGFYLWVVTIFGSRAISGDQLFRALSIVALICACLAGPALTADSVNEDLNNGTLGFLFLTNLSATSVSLGKLVGHGMLAFYSLVSIVPVMALPALMGGADALSLAKTALVLFVTLNLSLATGMLASTLCRKVWTAAALTLFLLATLTLLIPLALFLLRLNHQTSWTWLELFSPTYSLSMASPSAATLPSNHLWLALAAQSLMACAFFALTTYLLPRVWKEGKSEQRTHSLRFIWDAWRHGSGNARRRLRTHLLNINPILWLSSRLRWGPAGHALILLPLVYVISWVSRHFQVGLASADFLNPMRNWIIAMFPLYIGFCFRLAAAATERFAIDRKAGALELILCTPLSDREILRGHWLGLIRRFWGAALALLFLHAFVLNYIIEAIRIEAGLRAFSLRIVLADAAQHLLGQKLIPDDNVPFYIGCLAVLTAAFLIVALWIALAWLATALSLKLRRQIFAPWIALVLLAVPPIPIVIAIVSIAVNSPIQKPTLFVGVLAFGATGFLVVLTNAMLWLHLARRWTYQNLRGSPSLRSAMGSRGLASGFAESL